MNTSPMLRAALAYRQAFGLSPVLLGGKDGKRPLLKDWPHTAAIGAVSDIAKFWGSHPAANIGLLCGDYSAAIPPDSEPRTWIVVLDVDAHGIYQPAANAPESWVALAGLTGLEVLEELETNYGKLPDTPTAITPTGGRHYFFRHPGTPVPTRAGIWPGIDIRGDRNGQVVAAPSTRPDLGGAQYCWEASARLGDVPLATMPDWLIAHATGAHKRALPPPTGRAAESFLAHAFAHLGWLGREIDSNRIRVRCPWFQSHSDGRGSGSDSSAILFSSSKPPNLGRLVCAHAHCQGRSMREVLLSVPAEALADASNCCPDAGQLVIGILRGR